MTFSIGGTVLPIDPTRVTIQYAAEVREISLPSGKPWIIGWGDKSDKLRVEGTLAATGQTAANLETNFLTPYEAMINTEVAIAADDTRWDGTWIMTGFKYTEIGGFTTSFRYVFEFIKGDYHIML